MPQYHFPPIDLLDENIEKNNRNDLEYASGMKERLNALFAAFKTDAVVFEANGYGFCVHFKVKLGEGVTPAAVRKMQTEIEVALDGQRVEFLESRDGKKITIAIKTRNWQKIMLKDVIRSSAFRESPSVLTVAAGVNLFAGYTAIDLLDYTNLIVVGMTGTGKTTFLNDIILSILYKARPDEVRLAMIDTKGADLPLLNGIPHMKDMDAATTADAGVRLLKWLQNEMTVRLSLLKQKNVKSIDKYNLYAREKLPRYLLIIDEYAEFKRGTDEDLDQMLIEMAKFSKTTGIHLIVATQGARTDFLSAELKEAIPARACLAVADKRESNIVLKKTGADRLAGDGDMIITANEEDQGLFLQAAFASDAEIDRVAAFLRKEQLAE